MPDLLNSSQVSQILGVTPATLIEYALAGKILASFIARKWRFRQEDVETFIASQHRSR
jgi:predicted site-specific integrase-resolvase